MNMDQWIRLPTGWIRENRLTELKWHEQGSDATSALMALTAIAHHAESDSGVAYATYDVMQDATGISRSKLSAGLGLLRQLEVISCDGLSRSRYRLIGYSPAGGWAMFPAGPMYRTFGVIEAFRDFKLRQRAELDALKIYFLLIALRDRHSNLAHISYPKIEERSGVRTNFIKPALSLLSVIRLAYVEPQPRGPGEIGFSNAYRIANVESRKHAGTNLRAAL